jgi:hypothetical protein
VEFLAPPVRFVLFPGRHHLLTRFQAGYLRTLVAGVAADEDGELITVHEPVTIVWAVTSANHGNTRRNPIPYDPRGGDRALQRL